MTENNNIYTSAPESYLRVATWNVNSVNVRLQQIIDYCNQSRPDVLLLQELKTTNFPSEAFEEIGYNPKFQGQKSYNGVAILSKYPLDELVTIDFTDGLGEARYIEASLVKKGSFFVVASIYVPNGSGIKTEKYPAKLEYFRRLRSYMEKKLDADYPYIVGGDYNVAPEAIDVYDPITLKNSIGFHIDERKELAAITALGYTDCWRTKNPQTQAYSWWDYRERDSLDKDKGMRIDHVLANKSAARLLLESKIDRELRALVRPSDHVPVRADFSTNF